ncbi:FeoA family protein [Halohasta salina]|uniref:FeoA family protein n=1 Tax=Halohasta salina TaxID=2961621 RepID=UPI0020A4E0F6|nr:FeoA family protein [Halohasta salina]
MDETRATHAGESAGESSADGQGCPKRRQCQRGRACKRLVDLECGETGRIECVDCERRTLESMGVRPGKRIEVCTKHPFDGPVVVSVGRSTVSLSRSHARQLDVVTD